MRVGCHAALLQAVHERHIAWETKFWLHWSLVGQVLPKPRHPGVRKSKQARTALHQAAAPLAHAQA